MDRYSKFLAYAAALRGKTSLVTLLTKLHLNDGSTVEITNQRRAVCKKITRKRGSTVLSFDDLDLAALDQVYPLEVFTAADWPNIFTDDVGKRVPQGVGNARKVPLALIDTDGSTFWRYAGPKVVGSAGTVLAVYRGSQPGQGAIVDASEYTVGTATAPSGYQVVTVAFTREQIDFNGQPYVIEADFSLPGSRLPSDEVSRILTALGIAIDSVTFAAVAANDTTLGFLVDACYGDPGRTAREIIADLCDVARAWPVRLSTGEWSLIQDSTRASAAQFDTSCDLIEIDEYGDADVPAKVTLFYRPKASLGEEWSEPLSRPTNGASSEMQRHNPYIYEHLVADKYLSYWQKRHNSTIGPGGGVAKGTVYAAQFSSGDRITITDAVAFVGTKDFIAPGIERGADSNRLTLREYNADVYVYTPGVLPSDATNGYSPDFSFTDPAAPTSLTYVGGGTSIDADGKVRSRATVSCVAPTANFQKITFQITDTTTNEIYQAQGALSAGVYSAVIANLPPNRAMQLRAWATNANNRDGAVAGPVSFTSATSSAVPSAPTLSASQTYTFQLDYTWTASTPGAAQIKEYVLELDNGSGGSFAEKFRGRALQKSVPGLAVTGPGYRARVKAVDTLGNESAYSSINTTAVNKTIDDTFIASQGVSGGSIANGSINRGRASTATGSSTATIGAGSADQVALDRYAFAHRSYSASGHSLVLCASTSFPASGDEDISVIAVSNPTANPISVTFYYRNLSP